MRGLNAPGFSVRCRKSKMPDITMCKDSECPKSETCYRFTAKPWERQSYFATSPRFGDVCKYEIPLLKAMHGKPRFMCGFLMRLTPHQTRAR